MEPSQVREGMQLLLEESKKRERSDIEDACNKIIAMEDWELTARQHEITGLYELHINPIEHGYFEAAIAFPTTH